MEACAKTAYLPARQFTCCCIVTDALQQVWQTTSSVMALCVGSGTKQQVHVCASTAGSGRA